MLMSIVYCFNVLSQDKHVDAHRGAGKGVLSSWKCYIRD